VLSEFHFIRPVWLFAFIALPFVIYLIKKLQISSSGWKQILPPHLCKQMIEQGGDSKQASVLPVVLLFFLTVLALAGPTWKKLPQPVYQIAKGSVLIMDMSYSMYATDISPNRLTRARFKAIDLLDQLAEGDTGLIAYAGDAFTISPLTEDINNIKLLLPSLSPELMPELGSNPLAALNLAHQMLTNAGHIKGDIYWITDGIDSEDVTDLNDWSNQYPHQLKILGIGTNEGAPITLPNGQLLKDDLGAIVIPKLSEKLLQGIALNSAGQYRSLSHNNSDIAALVTNELAQHKQENESENTRQGDQWQEMGPYLILLILPCILVYFRRGALLTLLPITLLTVPIKQAEAVDWQSLWKTKDQQAQQAFNEQKYEKAANTFNHEHWQASSYYKAENYQAAAEAFAKLNTSDGFYNQGNALAKLNKLDEAIKAYERAIALDDKNQDAKDNKALLEQLKQQQEEQQQQNSEQKNAEQNNNNEQQEQQNKQQDESQSQDQQDQQQQGQEQQSSENSAKQNEQQEGEQSQQSSEQNATDENQEHQSQNAEQQNTNETEQEQPSNNADAKEGDKEEQSQQLTAAQEQANQEKEQKHQQLLKKVTDDPYLLLRNKMQLEYQKRRQEGTNSGVKKKW